MHKKIVSCLATFMLLFCGAFVACNKDTGNSSVDGNKEYAYVVTVVDQDENALKDIGLSLLKSEETVVEGVTDENGKAELKATVGEYTLVLDEATIPVGFIPDNYSYTVEITATGENALTIEIEDMNPDGTEEKPFTFIYGENGEMTITVPANTTHYYIVYRSGGRLLTVESGDLEIAFGGNTYTATNGKIEATLLGTEDDMQTGTVFAVVNKTANAVQARMLVLGKLGTSENPIKIVLGENATATVVPRTTVYYEFTATASGTLVFTTTSELNSISLYNTVSFVMSDYSEGALTTSIAVTEGDKIQIMVSLVNSASQTTEIPFVLSME